MKHYALDHFGAGYDLPATTPLDALFDAGNGTDFLRDTVHKNFAPKPVTEPSKGQLGEGLEEAETGETEPDGAYYVSRVTEFDATEVRPGRPARTAGKRKLGRPRKRGPKPKAKVDGRRRAASGPLNGEERRDILDAINFAHDTGMALDTVIDIQPAYLEDYPDAHIRDWFRTGPWRLTSQWLTRKGIQWAAVATRENYQGERREHFHMLCHCPKCFRGDLAKMLSASFPGRAAIHVGPLTKGGATYRLKQSSGNSMGPPSPGRPTPELRNRHDLTPVATVDGKRYFVSRSVDRKAREAAGWQQDEDHRRARVAAQHRDQKKGLGRYVAPPWQPENATP